MADLKHSFDTLADDLAAILDALDLQDVTLIAHSFASGEAVRYLSRHVAERISGLLLLAPAAVPTLIVQGDRDASAPLELTGQPAAALIRGARLEVYEGAPHGLYFTHQQRLNVDIARFATSAGRTA
jgi:pimeloyl-ACP methyl ester carboxylesterase